MNELSAKLLWSWKRLADYIGYDSNWIDPRTKIKRPAVFSQGLLPAFENIRLIEYRSTEIKTSGYVYLNNPSNNLADDIV